MDMQIDILTLFPESVDAMLNVSILGRAQERGYIAIRTHQIRTYTTNKQMQVDDYPYGGCRQTLCSAAGSTLSTPMAPAGPSSCPPAAVPSPSPSPEN